MVRAFETIQHHQRKNQENLIGQLLHDVAKLIRKASHQEGVKTYPRGRME